MMVPTAKMETEEPLACQGRQVFLALSDLKESLDPWGPLDRLWSGPLEQRERREPLEPLLETWWENREPKATEDCQGLGVRRVKPAVQGSLETPGKMVLKGLQDSRVRRVTQELGPRAPLGQLAPQVQRETRALLAPPVLLVPSASPASQALGERRVSQAPAESGVWQAPQGEREPRAPWGHLDHQGQRERPGPLDSKETGETLE